VTYEADSYIANEAYACLSREELRTLAMVPCGKDTILEVKPHRRHICAYRRVSPRCRSRARYGTAVTPRSESTCRFAETPMYHRCGSTPSHNFSNSHNLGHRAKFSSSASNGVSTHGETWKCGHPDGHIRTEASASCIDKST